jgi:hypothetical protein
VSAAPILDRDLSLDARAALNVAHAMSRANDSERRFGAAWQRALRGLTRPLWDAPDESTRGFAWTTASSRIIAERLFAQHGASPDEIARMEGRGVRSFVLKLSHGKRAQKAAATRTQEQAITEALALREEMNARVWTANAVYQSEISGAMRATHRAVHRAIVGESTAWCEWCAEGGQ